MIYKVGELHHVRPEKVEVLQLALLPGMPLGAAFINEGSGLGLAGYLRKNSCTNVFDRFIYVLRNDPTIIMSVRELLRQQATARMVGEAAWIEITGTIAVDPVVAFLLSREQQTRTGNLTTNLQSGILQLANGQTVESQYRQRPYRSIPLSWAVGYGGVTPDGEEYLQAIDSSSFSDVLDNPHSYFAILNSRTALNPHSGWIKVSNPLAAPSPDDRGQGVEFNNDLTTSFAVRAAYSDEVSLKEIALDETVSVAIGMRQGEVVRVESIDAKIGTFRRRAFSFRHTVVRVVSATTMDMEKPLVRLPAGVLDILGLNSGSRVVVEALSRQDNQIRRVSVRALEEREQQSARLGGVLDILNMTGSVDLPAMTMDLSLRNRLGIRRGDPVYVRPEFGTVVFEEFTTVSFALLAAAVGSFVANAQALAVTLTATYLALSAMGIWRKFR